MSSAGSEPRRWSSPPPTDPDAAQVFIACAPEELNTASQLRAALEPLVGWIPELDLVPGDVRDVTVARVLESCALVVVLVPSEPPDEWNHCEEVQQALALARGSTGLRRVVPVYLQGHQPPTRIIYGLRRIHGIYLAIEGSWAAVGARIRHTIDGSRGQATAIDGSTTSGELTSRLREIESERRQLAERHDTDPQLDDERRAIIHELRAGGRLNAGDILGERYTLRELLGRGGFGQVWRAYDEVHRLDVAVKVLHAYHATDPAARRRFARGVRAMAHLEHPNIVRVRQGVTEDEGLFFFAMSFLPGGDLSTAIKDGRVAPSDALTLIPPLADALAVAHQSGILHRDVKPANILLDAAGRPCLSDFDLARAPDSDAMTSGPLGSWGYAAPECRTDAGTAKPTADVFGLAMTTLAILLQRPMGEDDPLHIDRTIANSSDPLIQAFAPVLRPALRAHPDERTASMERLVAGLRSIERGAVSMPATPPAGSSAPASSAWSPQPAEPPQEADGSAASDVEEASGSLFLLGLVVFLIWIAWKKWG